MRDAKVLEDLRGWQIDVKAAGCDFAHNFVVKEIEQSCKNLCDFRFAEEVQGEKKFNRLLQ